MDEFDCPTCGQVFDSKRGLGVHHSTSHGEKLPNRECTACGEEFYREHEQKYCSDGCRDEAVSFAGEANPNYGGGKEQTNCEICGTEFEYYSSEKEGLYCEECVENTEWRHRPDIEEENHPRWVGGRITTSCDVCDSTVERYPSEIDAEAVLCSKECQSRWLSEAFLGDGHPNWEGGGTDNYGQGWNATRRAALERDDYACVRCGTDTDDLGRNPDVHHIVPVRVFVEADGQDRTDAHDLDNVASLCPGCHRRAEFGNVPRNRLRRAVGAR